jgi:hypothetical protein
MMDCYQIENVVSVVSGAKNGQNIPITRASINPQGEF